MTQPDASVIRERLRRAALEAETNPEFRAQLEADPVAALARFDLTPEDRAVGFAPQDRFGTAAPHGCADFTCIISEHPERCYITIFEF